MAETIDSLVGRVAESLEGADLFFGHGIDNALDEAYWLVLQVAGLPVDAPVDNGALPLDERTVERVDSLLARRISERVPLAYLLNSAWFAGLEFFVDERVLVPRSPIAELVLDGFRDWLDPNQVSSVLDLCTGSGCIGIACSYAFPHARIVASDISAEALAVAQVNVERHGVNDLVSLRQSDVFKNIDGRFDLIVSNPPYVDQRDMSELHEEFLREPTIGLAAGEDGLSIVDKILAQATEYLSDDGVLIVEVGNSAPQLEAKYPQLPFLWIEFEHGGGGVFALTARELRAHDWR